MSIHGRPLDLLRRSSRTDYCLYRSYMLPANSGMLLFVRYQSTSSPTPATPRRPSPYRLCSPTTFLTSFAPLHVSGWRLTNLRQDKDGEISDHSGDLQDRKLQRAFEFHSGKEGWKSLMFFSAKVMEEVEKQDHHPVIHISPASDYQSTEIQLSDDTGYVLELLTHTHTPLPPVGQPKDAGKMRPGVTGKDINLAEKLEEIYGNRE